jgi:hypothetical protein
MARLRALRELMRMELPERKTDLDAVVVSGVATASSPPISISYKAGLPQDPPASWVDKFWQASPEPMPAPALWHAFRRRAGYVGQFNKNNSATWYAPTDWTEENESSECLYMIVSNTMYGEDGALKFFRDSEIGDTDGDGRREILDAWGRPILFLRWAPGFTYTWGADGRWGVATFDDDGNGTVDDPIPPPPNKPVILERAAAGSDDELVSELQTPSGAQYPDPFDPLQSDSRWRNSDRGDEPFALVPLIFSAGRDGVYGIFHPSTDPVNGPFSHAAFGNDPYLVHDYGNGNPIQVGMPESEGSRDNITNHLLGTQ